MTLLLTFNSTRCIRNQQRRQLSDLATSFQLHTVHQELLHDLDDVKRIETFNSTRCIRNSFSRTGKALRFILTFNSTRCIRNTPSSLILTMMFCFQLHTVHQEPQEQGQGTPALACLSTPHGALGTRLIRCCQIIKQDLSTPHGALGTFLHLLNQLMPLFFQLHTVHQEPHPLLRVLQGVSPFNSTRCIRNTRGSDRYYLTTYLSTPHGALGTWC